MAFKNKPKVCFTHKGKESCWTKFRDTESFIAFVGEKRGVVTIQGVPDVDVKTIRITGWKYFVSSSKKYSKEKRFNTKSKALAHAKQVMKKF